MLRKNCGTFSNNSAGLVPPEYYDFPEIIMEHFHHGNQSATMFLLQMNHNLTRQVFKGIKPTAIKPRTDLIDFCGDQSIECETKHFTFNWTTLWYIVSIFI